MIYSIEEIREIVGARGQIVSPEAEIEHLLTDSRNADLGERSLFFAISGKNHDGHKYIAEAYSSGVKNFIVESLPQMVYSDANFLLVENSLAALQQLATFHRREFNIPVIGITGSNGKTVVKEWLYHLLKIEFDIVRSPKSYNSQLGVPLSVWALDEKNEVAIFEAGISLPGEMQNLEKIIQPTIGIITNITSVHNEGFSSAQEKTKEKLLLFEGCGCIIYRKDHKIIDENIHPGIEKISWSLNNSEGADIIIKDVDRSINKTVFTIEYDNELHHISIPFTDDASLENAIHAIIAAFIILKKAGRNAENEFVNIIDQAAGLPPISMRLELIKGNNNSIIINDAYSADTASLKIALQFLNNNSKGLKKTIIITDFDETGESNEALYKNIARLLKENGIEKMFGVGENISSVKDMFLGIDSVFFINSDAFSKKIHDIHFQNEIVLIKGARRFQLEKISAVLSQKTHGTVLYINLNNLIHNLNIHRSLLRKGVKTMAMVKSFSYGIGQEEIAGILSHHRIDYLAVAYTDEGIDLRRKGIKVPIMVMIPEPDTFDQIIQFDLEPEIYNFRSLELFAAAIINHNEKKYSIHIKLDTGMHRLGFEEKDIDVLLDILRLHPQLKIKSIFSHLSSADDEKENEFTQHQISLFQTWSQKIMDEINYPVLRHILNSSGINKFPEAQFEMVRLGIGLYGVDPSASIQNRLLPVGRLLTNIAQIKEIKKGDSVGYGRTFIADKTTRIATINIGYADGFSRKMGDGVGKVFINGKFAPVVGRVCMDMTMVDVSEIPDVKEGDAVEIFGDNISIIKYAVWQETIPYEIMTGISQRVKRVYLQE